MLSEFGIAKRVWSRCTALLVVAGFAACVDDSVAPAPEATPTSKTPRVIGFAELTFTGIGTPDFSSSMLVAPTLEALEELRAQRERSGDLRDFVAQDLTLPQNQDGSGSGTIQLALDQRQEFPPVGGVRYLNATYAVRNAQHDSAAGSGYDMERTNLTFLGVSSNNTVNQTAVRQLLLVGGTPAPAALALEVLPTDLLTAIDTPLVAAHPDVLQIFSEAEVAALTPPAGVTSVFPYGFVVRRVGSTTTRTLPASPAEGTFHGIVDFGFSIPVQPTSDQDPQTLSVLMLAVDDSETQMTQGLLEQTPEAIEALAQLDSTLNADTVTLLPGGTLPGDSGLRTLCSVRTAGMPGAATAHLVDVNWTFQSFSPSPNSLIAGNATLQATFSAPVDGAGRNNFVVRGLQSGTAFLTSTYSGNGTPTIQTPTGSFFAGEEVAIALTTGLSCPTPHVARYRVQSAQATGGFVPDTMLPTGNFPNSVAIGDLTGNGNLDAVVTNSDDQSQTISVFLGNGTGTFQPQPPANVATGPQDVAMGDFNGDGNLDVVVASFSSQSVSVLLSNGDGTFNSPPPSPYSLNYGLQSIAIGDLNGDGFLDAAAVGGGLAGGPGSMSVLLGNGDGTFQVQQPIPMGNAPATLAFGDLNGNGTLDVVFPSRPDFGTHLIVRLGNGDGTFQEPDTAFSGAASNPLGIAIGDLSGDGILDIVIPNQATSSVSVFVGNGNGTSFQGPQPFGVGIDPHDVVIADVDGNGILDIVTTNDANVSVLIGTGGTGAGAFQPQQTLSVGSGPRSVAAVDLNSNGILDLVTANFSADSVAVLLGQPQP